MEIDALKYPFDSGADNLVAGSFLVLFSVLLFPAVLLSGYFANVYRDALHPNSEPSEIPGESPITLFADGLKYLGIVALYALGPIVLLGMTVGIAEGISQTLADTVAMIMAAVWICALCLIPAAALHTLTADTLKAAFDLPQIIRIAVSSPYLRAVGVAFLFWLTVMFGLMVLIVTIVGFFLLPTAIFYAGTVIHRLFGNAYAEYRADVKTDT